MQVPEDPGHYGPSSATRMTAAVADISCPVPSAERQPEYAHLGSLDGISSMELTRFPRNNAKRHASYVARAPPTSRSARPIGDPRQQGRSTSSRAMANNRPAALGPLAEEPLSRGLSQQDCLSCLMSPTKSKPLPNPVPEPAQTRDQPKTLARFTKQLEKYSAAVNSNGKPELPRSTPTVSDSPTTLDTVTELLPYHKQFKAAGLAVTSREQMPRIPESTHPRRLALNNGSERHAHMAHVQVDGSTVTPSEQESVPEEPAASYVHDNEADPSGPHTQQQAPNTAATPVNKNLLPWFRKKDPATANKSHSNRMVSIDHIHPTRATAAEPYLTPSDKLGIIDAYFNSPSPSTSQNKQPELDHTSLSSSSAERESSPVEKTPRREPSIERQPVPRRSLRRHMEDTSQWPTAGVLIHNNSPSPEDHENEGVDILARTQGKPPVPAKDSTPDRLQPSATTEKVRKSAESGDGPPVPPKGPKSEHSTVACHGDPEKKPATPPKVFPETQTQPQVASRHHHGQSLCKPWSRVTVLRRKSHAKLPPVPSTITEEPEASREQLGKPSSDHDLRDANTVPQLPATWSCAVGRSSSFEKALDAVIQKLDDMDERRQYERKMELEAAQQAAVKLEASQELVSSFSSPNGSRSRRPTEQKQGTPAEVPTSDTNESATHLDRDIDDRDILLGLKMAICAACDENLDAWICDKTGLRLRRFLADLKAFDAVSKDRKAPVAQPPRGQARRTRDETRRLNAERERRRQSMKSKAWKGPCFGEDG